MKIIQVKMKKLDKILKQSFHHIRGTGAEYIYEEMNKLNEGNIQIVNDTAEQTKLIINWENQYGKLELR